MKNDSVSTRLTIQSLIERSFILATFTIFVITTIAALYFNQHSLQDKRDSNSQKIHGILSNLIVPVLNISDATEIRRLLQLASSSEETFVVIDSNHHSVLMPDYEKISLVKSVINLDKAAIGCEHLRNVYKHIDGIGYWINCTILSKENVLSENTNLGVLLSFSRDKWLILSPMILFFVGVSIVILLLIVIWFRQILYRRLLKPLVVLGAEIVEKAKSPLTANTSINDIGNAPYEVFAIKQAFETLLLNLQSEYQHRTETEKKAVLLDLAAQVAHDIRSPLAVMEMTLRATSKYLPVDDANIQKEAIQSVRDIANNLLNRYRKPNEVSRNHILSCQDDGSVLQVIFIHSLIEQVISHKRQEWQDNDCEINFQFKTHAKFFYIYAVPNDIKRVLSNLFNNAYESLTKYKAINVLLDLSGDYIGLHIIDNGVGIPGDKINAVLTGTSLKHGGKGLGLSSAKKMMENINGVLTLTSILGQGTQVTLFFPKVKKPSWFPGEIKLPHNVSVIVLDDDPSIHSLWRQRLHLKTTNALHFQYSQDVIQWQKNNSELSCQAIFLVDYELRDDVCNGLELLQQLNVGNRGYLITSHASEVCIQASIEAIESWLIPKSLIGYFPLEEVK